MTATTDQLPPTPTPTGRDDMTGKQLYRVPEAMAILSLGRSAIYEQLRSGRLRSVHEGRTRLVPAAAITDYVALLEREAASESEPLRRAS